MQIKITMRYHFTRISVQLSCIFVENNWKSSYIAGEHEPAVDKSLAVPQYIFTGKYKIMYSHNLTECSSKRPPLTFQGPRFSTPRHGI